MARSRIVSAPAKNDVYFGMVLIATLAMLVGVVLLVWETMTTYDWQTTPPAWAAPALPGKPARVLDKNANVFLTPSEPKTPAPSEIEPPKPADAVAEKPAPAELPKLPPALTSMPETPKAEAKPAPAVPTVVNPPVPAPIPAPPTISGPPVPGFQLPKR